MSDTAPYSVPKEPGRWRAITLAAIMHAALLAFLWIGIRWQNQTPVAIEAEVWNLQSKEAAPKAQVQPQPQPEPEVKPEPIPEPKKAVVVEPPKEKPVPVKPEIVLEQEKKRKALAEHERQEAEKRAEKQREVREKEKQAEKLKKEQEQEQLAKKEADERIKKKTEELKKKREQEAKDKQLAQYAEKLRAEDMKRLNVGSGGSGDAPKSQGSRGDAGYGPKLAAKIRSNTVFIVPNDVSGNPAVEYEVKLFPDGTLRGTPRKIKSSGIPGFDEAVLRAIELSQPFPPDKSGAVPSGFPVIHHLKDQ